LYTYAGQQHAALGRNFCAIVPADRAAFTDVREDHDHNWVKCLQVVEDDDARAVLPDVLVKRTTFRRFHASDRIQDRVDRFPLPDQPGTKVIDALRISKEQACKIGRKGGPRKRLISNHQKSVNPPGPRGQPPERPELKKIAASLDQGSAVREPVVARLGQGVSLG
jgi:hypothetical protein